VSVPVSPKVAATGLDAAPDATDGTDAAPTLIGADGPAPAARPHRWLEALPALAAAVVLLAAGAALLATTWHPVGDYAIAEIIVRHLFPHPPLFGPYSGSRPYHHPLPLVYALVWAPYEIFGQRSSAQLAATVWFNAVLIGLLVWITTRRRALGLGLLLLGAITLFARTNEPGHLSIPWNPYLGFVPAVVLVVVVWQTTLGRRWYLPLATGLATWCVGAHIGYAPTAVGLAAVTIVGLPLTLVRRHGRAGWRLLGWPLLASLGVLLVMVSPALADLAQHGSDSNPSAIWRWVQTSKDPIIPSHTAWQAIFGDLSLRATWATGHRPYAVFGRLPHVPVPLLLVPLVLAVGFAAWRRAGDELAALATVSVAVLTTAIGILNLQSNHLVDWYLLPMHAMGVSLAGIVAWSLCRSAWHVIGPHVSLPESRRRLLRTAGATVVAAALALLIVPTLHEQKITADMAAAPASLVPSVERAVPKSHTIVLVSPYKFDGYHPEALALDLDRAGYTVRYLPRDAYLFGKGLTILPKGRPVTYLYTKLATPDVSPAPGARLLGQSRPIPAALVAGLAPMVVWQLPHAP